MVITTNIFCEPALESVYAPQIICYLLRWCHVDGNVAIQLVERLPKSWNNCFLLRRANALNMCIQWRNDHRHMFAANNQHDFDVCVRVCVFGVFRFSCACLCFSYMCLGTCRHVTVFGFWLGWFELFAFTICCRNRFGPRFDKHSTTIEVFQVRFDNMFWFLQLIEKGGLFSQHLWRN